MMHAEADSSTDISSSSSSPIHLQHEYHHQDYTIQSPSTLSHDEDKSSIESSSIGPPYIVQSPSSDSHDGDRSSVPDTTSPSRTSSDFSSSGSRVSGRRRNWNWNWNRNRYETSWNQCYVIVEEPEEEENQDGSDVWQLLVLVLLGFGLMSLIFWGVATPYKPRVAVESLAMNDFYFGEGSDYTGVPTKFITLNCTLHMTIRNTGSFFGIHISSSYVKISYLDIIIANAQMRSYYQPRKSETLISLNLNGKRVPLYGAGSSLALAFTKGGVLLRLDFDIRSHVNVVGKIVKTKHLKHISCSANIGNRNNGVVRLKEDSCKYN